LEGELTRKTLIILIVLFGVFLAIGCTGNRQVTPNETRTPEQAATPSEVTTPTEKKVTERQTPTKMQNVTEKKEIKEYTLEELAKYNGRNGKIYVAYQGQVYDVSASSYRWKDGSHNGCNAGKDITEEINKTRHGPEVLKAFPVVGTLKK
jgi:predicted heme/steroid binding protein